MIHVVRLMEIWLRIVACLDRSVHAFPSCRERHRLQKSVQNDCRPLDHWDCGPGDDALRENRIVFEIVSDIHSIHWAKGGADFLMVTVDAVESRPRVS